MRIFMSRTAFIKSRSVSVPFVTAVGAKSEGVITIKLPPWDYLWERLVLYGIRSSNIESYCLIKQTSFSAIGKEIATISRLQ